MKNKMLRGQVLRTLALFYPDSVSVNGIRSALISRGVTFSADMTKILHYLEDKEYITVTAIKLSEIKDDDQVELTAKGVDLIEETIDDPGVEL